MIDIIHHCAKHGWDAILHISNWCSQMLSGHIPDDDESDGKIPNQDLPNKPRNPPIVSEIEEELKPGNRSKNVSDLFRFETYTGPCIA